MVEINKLAPEFCLKDQNEDNVCLNDFKGKWVVLYFYPKDNTPGCTLEAIYFNRYAEEFKKNNTIVIGISPDSCDSHKNFSKKHDLSLILLSDSEHEVLEKYDAWKPKKMFGKNFLGAVRSTYIIDPEGKIKTHWPKVQVNGHVDEVLDRLHKIQKTSLNVTYD